MSARPTTVPTATLTVVSGRPGTGKTTLAKELARRRRSCYLRVDAAETALARSGLQVGAEGYAVIHEIAVSNLLLGIDVVVDAVNPVPEARAGWRDAAARGGAGLVQVETWLAEAGEHRRRVEARTPDMPGQLVPTWDEVVNQPWVPWDEVRDGPRALVATQDAGAALAEVMALTPGL
ncbi:AAA family ATPase [Terrabacter sp. NPDC000476]|uniref:AAA family ATPase n=1 Tax=Terrabacter sp. NPDC000476 TaxID=3154258 RepID=UPI003321810B